MISAFPDAAEVPDTSAEGRDFDRVIAAIAAIRARRAEMNVPPSRKAKVILCTEFPASFEGSAPFFAKLASASETVLAKSYDSDDAVSIITDAATIYIPMSEMIDTEKERARLAAELKKTNEGIARTEGKLGNEGFVSKAPAAVVEAERERLTKLRATAEALEAAIAKLK